LAGNIKNGICVSSLHPDVGCRATACVGVEQGQAGANPPEILVKRIARSENARRSACTSMNDDRSPLLDLMTCIICRQTMKLEKADPDGEGNDLIQYRCMVCRRKETVRLVRRPAWGNQT
jgi:hypothetical protein